jgi:broad specificity phosphatase PhoE
MGELQGRVYNTAKLPVGESTVETASAFTTRALAWWRDKIVAPIASLPEREQSYNILVVSHGGFIKTMVRNLIQSRQLASDRESLLHSLSNTSISLIEWDGKAWKLVRYGDVSHLSAGPLDHNVDEIQV